MGKTSGGYQSKSPTQLHRGRGQWRGGNIRDRGRGSGMSRGMSSGRGQNSGGRGHGLGGFDPLACYRCGVRGHLACDCPSTSTQSLTLSGGSFAPTRGSSFKYGQSVPRHGRQRGRQVRFGGLNVVYDEEGYEYPIDNFGQLYVPLEFEQIAAKEVQEEKEKGPKN